MKIFSLALLLVMAAVGCKPEGSGSTGKKGALVGEWKLAMWNEAEPEFNVYIDFNLLGFGMPKSH